MMLAEGSEEEDTTISGTAGDMMSFYRALKDLHYTSLLNYPSNFRLELINEKIKRRHHDLVVYGEIIRSTRYLDEVTKSYGRSQMSVC